MLIIFDLDDTLIDTSGCITPVKLEDGLHRMVESGLLLPDFSAALEQLRRIDEASLSSKHSVKEFLEINQADPRFLEIGLKEIYGALPDAPLFPFEGVPEVLAELRLQHHLALVSMGRSQRQQEKLKKAGIDTDIFSKIVFCEEPVKKIHYRSIADELGLSPAEGIVCGDRIEIDLAPAKELGFKTIHLRKGRGRNSVGSKNDVDYTVSDFIEIREIIGNLYNFLGNKEDGDK